MLAGYLEHWISVERSKSKDYGSKRGGAIRNHGSVQKLKRQALTQKETYADHCFQQFY